VNAAGLWCLILGAVYAADCPADREQQVFSAILPCRPVWSKSASSSCRGGAVGRAEFVYDVGAALRPWRVVFGRAGAGDLLWVAVDGARFGRAR